MKEITPLSIFEFYCYKECWKLIRFCSCLIRFLYKLQSFTSSEEPAEGASSRRLIVNQLKILRLSIYLSVRPGPVACFMILFCEVFDRREGAPLLLWNSRPVEVREVGAIASVSLPLSREGSVVIVGTVVLEKQDFVACIARVELGLELDRSNLDSLATRLPV